MKLLVKQFETASLRCVGIKLQKEKTKTWNRAGVVPDNIGEKQAPESSSMLSCNEKVRVASSDARRIEVFAQDLLVFRRFTVGS